MSRPHFRRHPRPIDPNPEYSRLDRLIGRPEQTRYDAQWPDVLAAEAPAPLVDLPADQSGFTALADWPVWDYGEGYEIEPEERAVVHYGSVPGCALCADLPELPMVRAAATAYDLGLPVPLRSDPPLYRACLAEHVTP